MPYVSLNQPPVETPEFAMGYSARIERNLVSFDCVGKSAATLDAIIDALIAAYLPIKLTITGAIHLTTLIDSQQHAEELPEGQNVFVASVTLDFMLQK